MHAFVEQSGSSIFSSDFAGGRGCSKNRTSSTVEWEGFVLKIVTAHKHVKGAQWQSAVSTVIVNLRVSNPAPRWTGE